MDYPVPYLTLQALGLATGTVLCGLLAALQWKAKNLDGSRLLRTALPLGGSLWAAGSFAGQIVLLAGLPMRSPVYGWTMLVAWTPLFVLPSMWLRLRDQTSQRRPPLRRVVLILSAAIAASLTIIFPATLIIRGFPIEPGSIIVLSAYNAILHGVAILLMYRFGKSSTAVQSFVKAFLPFVALQMLIVIAIIHFRLSRRADLVLEFVSQQAVILNVIFAASLLAKFQYADVLLKRSLNIILSIIVASIAVSSIPGISPGIPVVIVSLVGAALLLASPQLHRAVACIVDRGLLRRPEYGALAHDFAEQSDRAGSPAELFALAEKIVKVALHVGSVSVILATEESREAGERILVRAPDADYVLLIPRTPGGRRLLEAELVFLEAISREITSRLEALEFERERHERQLREARLQFSLTEAELKALRAQIDPHFLFNTLNTIVYLITSNPAKAETMTERLAEFFRYTLTRTERTMATLDEELRFARQYLDIEQVRFGDRLHVEFSAPPELANEMVPALILQPLVENAVRHGLAPKPEGGCVSVSAAREGGVLRLEVVDNGVGMLDRSGKTTGIGLQNVRNRLLALYGDAAKMNIDSDSTRGTHVSLVLPANGH